MKTEKNILIAFLLNFTFAILEFLGGTFTGSVAIISDAVHDIGDSLSIGISYFLEKKSHRKPDEKYTYGYIRYSVLGGLITTTILLAGSIIVIYNSILRLLNPIDINYDGMIIFAIFGSIVNFIAAYFTKEGNSINQRSVNLHMFEDVLGWVVVLIGAIVMRFSDVKIIDPIMSIGVSIFIFVHALKNAKIILDLFLEKTPTDISVKKIQEHLLKLDNVSDVHHIHIWSLDGYNNYATMHVVSNEKNMKLKSKIREELANHGITHVTIEIESEDEKCCEKNCTICTENDKCNINHHYHH